MNSNQPQDGQFEVDYGSAYLNNLLQPTSNPHAGILPNTSRSYMQHTYIGGTNAHMDLSILDSETHNDSRVIEEIRSSSGSQARSNDTTLLGGLVLKQASVDSEALSSKQPDGRSRKKSRTNSQGSDDEATSKKVRGRPRVDTTDETAADRRRTQIRLAQRAYRLRKETTISSLKEKVSELQSAIEDVNKSFLKFNDNAMNSGLIQMRPDLARDLKEATEQFLTLARMANSDQDIGFDDEEEESGKRDLENVVEDKPKTTTRRGTAKRTKRAPPAPEKSKPDPWGYRVEPEEEQPLNENGKRPNKLSPIPEPPKDESRHGWESTGVSRSPIPSTSGSRFGPAQSLQQYRVEVPPLDQYPGAFNSQQAAPPLPYTLTFQETGFARRLHRAAIERGCYLLLSPNSPPSEVERVFGFCFTFNSREEILQRMSVMLAKSTKESLEYSQAPFLHIGGAGFHYPRKGASRNPRTMRTDLTLPVRSIGPMALALSEGAREKGITPEEMISLVGLDGEWFDPLDVEGYLREKGFVFPGESSFAEIEVSSPGASDTASAMMTPLSPTLSGGNSGNNSSTNSHPSPSELSASYNQDFDFHNDILFAGGAAMDPFTGASMIPENDSYFNPNVEKPLRRDGDGMFPPPMDPFGFGGGHHMQNNANVTSIPHILNGNAAAGMGKRKRIVSIDISVLVNELINRGRCLGKAPGFRKKDVDEAIRIATIPTY
ncbi:hypothetical protein FGG08_002662 [Glutinoglossum americanum]|uniref:BZIP domain-containing protein n=1 Tax=Glutinoglossum americanum TaxID=1670608 RepID=A0A9P8I8T4_9PEZI|nr:hypothetical protein FGG08_002662 [Glutinoglossum americanum]